MTTTTIHATPCKLRNGSWGARTSAPVAIGDTVTITTRGGKTWDARVTHVVWTGDGVAIVATESLDRPAPRNGDGCSRSAKRSRGIWTGCSCGSVEEYERDNDCFTCRHDR